MPETVPHLDRGVPANGHVRLLEAADLTALRALADRDPLVNLFVRQRLSSRQNSGLGKAWLGTQWWGYVENGRLVSACHIGSNIVPVAATSSAVEAFAMRLARRDRRTGSLVGPSEAMTAMWERIEPAWGDARSLRLHQPLLAISRNSRVAPDPAVRVLGVQELGQVYPVAVKMFSEEMGIHPDPQDSGAFRSRVRELLAAGLTIGIMEVGRQGPKVVFKADVSVAMPDAAQLTGVWMAPELRGRGFAAAAMAAVVQIVRANVAPTVTLYVNDYNTVARRLYDRVGFEQIGEFGTVLL